MSSDSSRSWGVLAQERPNEPKKLLSCAPWDPDAWLDTSHHGWKLMDPGRVLPIGLFSGPPRSRLPPSPPSERKALHMPKMDLWEDLIGPRMSTSSVRYEEAFVFVKKNQDIIKITERNTVFLEIKKKKSIKKKSSKEGLDFKVISRKYSKSKRGRRRENSKINSGGLIWDE